MGRYYFILKVIGKLLILHILLIILISGCTPNSNNNLSTQNNLNNTTNYTGGTVEVKEVTNLMQQLQSESQVLSASTTKKEDTIIATINFKPNADKKNAKELAEKYAQLFKTTYKMNRANVKIIQNETTLADVTI
jgi:ABC-type Fe3+-hydroxamate transport system substrate-binding protein